MIAILLPFILIVFFLYIIYFGFLQKYMGSEIGKEGFEGEETITYLPDPKSGISREIKLGEWIKESQMILGFLKVDNKLMKEVTNDKNSFEQYRADPTSLEGYKITSSYETNDDILNKKYGEFFTGNSWPDKLAKATEFEEFKQKWINVCMPVSAVYSKTHHHFRIKNENRKSSDYDKSLFATICFEWMENCRESSQENLDKAKAIFYDIVRNQEVQSAMIAQFLNNIKYMGQDDALYLLNTSEDFLSKPGEKLDSKDEFGFLQVGGIKSTLHIHYVRLYQVSALLYGIIDWIRKIGGQSKLIKTGPEQFHAGFEKYVKVSQPNMKKDDLFTYYLLDNMPIEQ